MLRVEKAVDVERPASEVWEFVADQSKLPRWLPFVVGERNDPPGPARVGTVRVLSARIGEVARERFVAWDEAGREYQYELAGAPSWLASYRAWVRVEARGDGARVVWGGQMDLPQGLVLRLAARVGMASVGVFYSTCLGRLEGAMAS